jgi:hypothetical protein
MTEVSTKKIVRKISVPVVPMTDKILVQKKVIKRTTKSVEETTLTSEQEKKDYPFNLVDVFADGILSQYIKDNLGDPWHGTLFEGYVFLSPKQKGVFGERFISKLLEIGQHEVKKGCHVGHDRIIDGIQTEMKFSLAIRDKKRGGQKDHFMINHISKDKEWQRLLFVGVNSVSDIFTDVIGWITDNNIRYFIW